jgi:hypothetical protein
VCELVHEQLPALLGGGSKLASAEHHVVPDGVRAGAEFAGRGGGPRTGVDPGRRQVGTEMGLDLPTKSGLQRASGLVPDNVEDRARDVTHRRGRVRQCAGGGARADRSTRSFEPVCGKSGVALVGAAGEPNAHPRPVRGRRMDRDVRECARRSVASGGRPGT